MAVNDTMMLIAIGYAFTYLALYRKNKFIGGMLFIALGLAVLQYINTNAGNAIGLMLLLGSVANLIYDIAKKLN